MAEYDPILLEIMNSLLSAAAEEMGAALGRTAYSPNIKERRDFSCAVFDAAGDMVAQAAHIPVHLGAMPMSVAAAIARFPRLGPGDIVVLNDPYAGGSHLPDITMVSPVFGEDGALLGYVASRAHHADVGGIAPGSMPLAQELYQEGLIIPPVLLQRGGALDEGVLDLITRNSRTPDERLGDLSAQLSAQQVGTRRLRELAARYGPAALAEYMAHLQDYAERALLALLRKMPRGRYEFTDLVDDDGFGTLDLAIRVAVEPREDELLVDFTGSAGQAAGGLNAVRAVTLSAVYYVVRCLVDDPAAPANAGIFRRVRVVTEPGSVVDARFPAAVAGGNVETSQRIVDAVLGAFAAALPGKIPAASQGTMNNVTIGGIDPRTDAAFAYYETIAGGMGASASADGLSGVHVHMTNTLNTPAEAVEYAYPLRVTEYALRRGSGGAGERRGGDGLVREIELLADATVTILSERRRHAPHGVAGGGAGERGINRHNLKSGETRELPGKATFAAERGERVRIETPGGGGYGRGAGLDHGDAEVRRGAEHGEGERRASR
jgi:N-methylhydantoinase B